MKTFLIVVLLFVYSLTSYAQQINLSGNWRFAIDREEVGIEEQWYLKSLDDEVHLPGSMLTNGKGDSVNLQPLWTGTLGDRAFFKLDKYERYRKEDNFKIPFWLQPDKYYTGVAWYQRDVDIPENWKGRAINLSLERVHWESRVWVDGVEAGMQNALATAHEYNLTRLLTPGKHVISIRVDNKVRDIDPGANSHSISDHTQGNWNGIVGAIFLEAKSAVYSEHIDVYPSLAEQTLGIRLSVCNIGTESRNVDLVFRVKGQRFVEQRELVPGRTVMEFSFPLPEGIKEWDEFNPNLYTLDYSLYGGKKILDKQSLKFGCRDWKVKDGVLHLNGHPAFMRGTLHCAAFPLTGFPATDKKEWLRELRICKAHGINHIRFHSWCPPEAAFEAADELGVYYQIECSSWPNQTTSIGDGKPIDAFLRAEAERIVKAYGNHPSFCLLSCGNESAGKHKEKYLNDFVTHWKQTDNRRLYTSTAGWPILPINDFLNDHHARIQGWGEQLRSVINAKEPSTAYDWNSRIAKFVQPYISHEIGQWCVYPNFREMEKYTGVYKARNFEIFQESLKENGLGALADSFLIASGKLQTLCYKADIEAALRTKNFGGFQLLGLNDFPGQGTALVGVLDAFWEEKGYVSPEEYSRFCNSIVPLARMEKLVYENNEVFEATVEVANYKKRLLNPDVRWSVKDEKGHIVEQGTFPIEKIELGNCWKLGNIRFPLSGIYRASQLNLEISVDGRANDWDFWVYPIHKKIMDEENILLVDHLDETAVRHLHEGGNVLLSIRKDSLSEEFGGDIGIGFSSIFWNTSWTKGQAPHTLGILCNPKHPALADFPTEFHSNYQWWDAMSHSGAIRIDKLSQDIRPIVRVIDDWFANRPLALLFEVKVAKGRLLVSGIDFHGNMEKRPAARQLLHSLKIYMLGNTFNPQVSIDIKKMMMLTK